MFEVLRIAASVTTPLALLGLVAALGYFAYTRRLKYEEKKLEALPPDQRAARTDEYLTRYGIDGKRLSVADKVALIKDEMEKRHRRSFGYVIVAAVVFIVCFGLAVLAYVLRSSEIKPLSSRDDDKMISLTLHQELTKFRDILSQPPREDRQPPGQYPHVYESGKFAKWNEPRKSSVNQIVMLAELDPMAVVRALIPLLSDSGGVVVAGALCALRDILVKQPKKADDLRKLLPKFKGDSSRLNLRDTYISNEDFSTFKGTDIFYNLDMRDAVIENTHFDGLQLTYANFTQATILNCSFINAVLTQSRWVKSRVRATTFEDANMYWINASDADFGIASSDPTTFFGSNLFERTNLNDADLVGASMVGARMDNAKLNSTMVWGADFTDARMGHEGCKEVSEELLRSAGAVLPILQQPKVKYGRRY